MTPNEKLIAKLAIADALLALVSESKLLHKPRRNRTVRRRRRTTTTGDALKRVRAPRTRKATPPPAAPEGAAAPDGRPKLFARRPPAPAPDAPAATEPTAAPTA